jgi:phospholipid transport system substrate-binding protein
MEPTMKAVKLYCRLAVLLLACSVFAAADQAPENQTQAAPAAEAGAPTLAVQELAAAARDYSAKAEAAGARLNAVLDLREMARLILASNWDRLKPAQRERYSGLLEALVRKIGYPQMEKFFNEQPEIKYTGESQLDGGRTAVFTAIYFKADDLKLSTEFRLLREGSAWRVYDVITDGESLLLIYRNQHAGIIKQKGFPELLKLMAKKLDEKK